MHIDEAFSTLLGALYEGPLEEAPWQSFLARVRACLGADLVTLLLRPPSLEEQSVMLADGGSLSAIRSYNEGQFVLDPFVNLPAGEVVCLHEHLSTDNLLESEFYRVVMEPQGWYDFVGIDIRRAGELDVRFRAGRHVGAPAFGEQEKRLLRALLPHLERSLRLHARMSRSEGERAVYAGAVEQLQVATIILDEQGVMLSCNVAAQALLERGDYLALKDGRPALATRALQAEFDELLGAVRRDRGTGGEAQSVHAMRLPAAEGEQFLGLVVRSVAPAGAVSGRGTPSVALFISDPAHSAEPRGQVISRLFNLTRAEASLALHLAGGLSLDEAAAALGVSRNTARAHLRSVFAKTGVSRQAGLVRLILSSVATLGGAGEPANTSSTGS